VCIGVVAALTGCGSTPEAAQPAPRLRNVIVMISDGCGFKHVEAASLFAHGKPGRQTYESFPCKLAANTSPMLWRDGVCVVGKYEPDSAWTDFDYVKGGYADSAAAATALSTGHKTTNGALAVGPDGVHFKHMAERCEELGMATGVVSSVQFAHATPAGFVAHNESRGNYEEIAREMLFASGTDCIMGCGSPLYDGAGRRRESPGGYQHVGGRELWQALEAGTAGAWDSTRDDANGNGRPDPGEWVDADHNGKTDDAWTLVQSRADFQALMRGPTPKRVIGVPQVASTLQQGRGGDAKAGPFEVPLIETVPSLAEMSQAALNVLDDDPDGLFLMIEGGAVDWASHNNQSGRMIEEQRDFDKAVEAVVQWVESRSSWDETLLVVTADHECGYLTAGAGIFPDEPLANNGPGRQPGMAWNSGSHTNSLVPLYARGLHSKAIADRAVGVDPCRGPYVDNTVIAVIVFDALAPRH
jgi:alkaline phosphatase